MHRSAAPVNMRFLDNLRWTQLRHTIHVNSLEAYQSERHKCCFIDCVPVHAGELSRRPLTRLSSLLPHLRRDLWRSYAPQSLPTRHMPTAAPVYASLLRPNEIHILKLHDLLVLLQRVALNGGLLPQAFVPSAQECCKALARGGTQPTQNTCSSSTRRQHKRRRRLRSCDDVY